MIAATRVLERLSRLSPLGLRFWDEGTGAVVSNGLQVEIYPAGQPERRVAARPNRSGTFVASSLPGRLRPEIEFASGDDRFWSQVRAQPFVVEVKDLRDQFQPFTFELPLPARGLAVPWCVPQASPPATAVPLFSTASRLMPAGMAIIRADLRYPVMSNGRVSLEPAAYAVLEARVAGSAPVRGVADRVGRIAVVVPYPEPAARPIRPASPPFPGGQALVDQEWSVTLDAYFEPVLPVPPIPELCRTLTQTPALVWADALQQHPLGEQALRYGRELIVRSEGAEDRSVLIVTPAGSPP
jgi:hypothetical protein